MDINALAVLALMLGSGILSALAAYFYQKAKCEKQRSKTQQFNDALVALQEERAQLIVKNQIMFTDNASMQTQIKHLTEQQIILRGQMRHLENEKQVLDLNYQNLERLLFAYSPELKESPILGNILARHN